MRANRVARWLREVVLGRIGAQIENHRDGDEQTTDLLHDSHIVSRPVAQTAE
jgi:hypothetical protein